VWEELFTSKKSSSEPSVAVNETPKETPTSAGAREIEKDTVAVLNIVWDTA
jgi:hypothetical protein